MVDPANIRARIVGRRMTYRPTRNGRPLPVRSWMHWHLSITDGEKVINTDDCRDLADLHEDAVHRVHEYRIRALAGHEFKPWSQLVAEATC